MNSFLSKPIFPSFEATFPHYAMVKPNKDDNVVRVLAGTLSLSGRTVSSKLIDLFELI